MLLALDVGNTNIKIGLFENGTLSHSWRMTSNRRRTADEFGIQMESFFHHLDISTREVDGIIMSSVIPSLNYTMEHMCKIYFHNKTPLMVDSTLKTNIVNHYDHPETMGTDRICNAVASVAQYPGDCMTIDFGTATNFVVTTADKQMLGGLICPGFQVAVDALIENTAMLPKVEYNKPEHIICTNTETSIQAGIIYGYVGQMEYIIKKIKQELGRECRVVATGGVAPLIASETDYIDLINPTLTLEGLNLLYEMNK